MMAGSVLPGIFFAEHGRIAAFPWLVLFLASVSSILAPNLPGIGAIASSITEIRGGLVGKGAALSFEVALGLIAYSFYYFPLPALCALATVIADGVAYLGDRMVSGETVFQKLRHPIQTVEGFGMHSASFFLTAFTLSLIVFTVATGNAARGRVKAIDIVHALFVAFVSTVTEAAASMFAASYENFLVPIAGAVAYQAFQIIRNAKQLPSAP
jgi:hypothetical protein